MASNTKAAQNIVIYNQNQFVRGKT